VRAHANARVRVSRGGAVTISPTDSDLTHVHELGHQVEFNCVGAKKVAQEFLAYRVKDQELFSLKKLFPDSNYQEWDKGRDDEFMKAFGRDRAWYVGKHYYDSSTEVISMGVEELYNNPARFASRDPQFCKFIVGIPDGSLRKP
jgi:hypothetical protein